MSRPLFLFAGAYEDVASAEGDYEVLKILASVGDLDECHAAVVARRADGGLEVRKTEKHAERGSSVAAVEAWLSDMAEGISAAVASEVAWRSVESGRAALVVVGIASDAPRVEQTAVEAKRSVVKHLTAE